MECTTLEEVLQRIGETAVKEIKKANSKEEKAFYLGMINLVSAIVTPEVPGQVRIRMNYEKVKADYEAFEAKQNKNQITLEELFPELFAELDKRIEERLKKKKSNKTEE